MKSRMTSLAIAALSIFATPALGQGLEIDWFSIDSGGIMFATGSGFELGATIGQPDSSPVLSGSGFELVGGFWAVGLAVAPPCPGDLDGDGQVALADLTTLLSNFGVQSGATFAQGDSDGDGDIDIADLSELLANFGTVCP